MMMYAKSSKFVPNRNCNPKPLHIVRIYSAATSWSEMFILMKFVCLSKINSFRSTMVTSWYFSDYMDDVTDDD